MKVLHSLSELAQIPTPLCVAIGVFDGVHLGHQALIRRAIVEAEKMGGSAVVLTFHPHPARVLRPRCEACGRLFIPTRRASCGPFGAASSHIDPAQIPSDRRTRLPVSAAAGL